MKQKRGYDDKIQWDDISHGEARDHISKRMTSRTHKLKTKKEKKNTNWKNRYLKGDINE